MINMRGERGRGGREGERGEREIPGSKEAGTRVRPWRYLSREVRAFAALPGVGASHDALQ